MKRDWPLLAKSVVTALKLPPSAMGNDLPAKSRHVRWWLVVTLSVALGAAALVAAFLTVNASMDATSNEEGDMRVAACGIILHQERGPWQPLEKKMLAYGWSLVGAYIGVGMLLGAGIGFSLRRQDSI